MRLIRTLSSTTSNRRALGECWQRGFVSVTALERSEAFLYFSLFASISSFFARGTPVVLSRRVTFDLEGSRVLISKYVATSLTATAAHLGKIRHQFRPIGKMRQLMGFTNAETPSSPPRFTTSGGFQPTTSGGYFTSTEFRSFCLLRPVRKSTGPPHPRYETGAFTVPPDQPFDL